MQTEVLLQDRLLMGLEPAFLPALQGGKIYVQSLKWSNLLLSGLCSAVPGFIEIGDRSMWGRHNRLGQRRDLAMRSLVSGVP
jgi:hypothetical protein